jgi:hypothetical protein
MRKNDIKRPIRMENSDFFMMKNKMNKKVASRNESTAALGI